MARIVRRALWFGLCLVLAAGCIGLGGWQLRRLAARRAANRAAVSARAMPPLSVSDGTLRGLLSERRATLTGTLDEAREFLLRDRVIQGVPAVMVVTPLRIPGADTAVLVNRGYVPAPDAVDPGPAGWSEPDRHEFTGILLPIPTRGDGLPLVHQGHETWKGLDLEAMRGRLPYPIASLYLLQESDSGDGIAHTTRGTIYPFRAQPPALDDGPHLMYAIQWFGIAAAVLAFGWLFIGRELRGSETWEAS